MDEMSAQNEGQVQDDPNREEPVVVPVHPDQQELPLDAPVEAPVEQPAEDGSPESNLQTEQPDQPVPPVEPAPAEPAEPVSPAEQ
jgi:hypothetical protein